MNDLLAKWNALDWRGKAKVVGIVVFSVAGWGYILTPEDLKPGFQPSSNTVVEVEAEEPTISASKQRTLDAIPEFREFIRNADPDSALVAKVEAGAASQLVDLTMTDGWHYQPKSVRRQTAQNFQAAWRKIRGGGDRDKGYIRLLDSSGRKVGGSGFGESVEVDD